jgi:hypothetical protein
VFLTKFFPIGKTHAVREEISNFQQNSKSLCWESQDHVIDPPFITKREDPGRPTITCSIGPYVFHNAFCDLGASINIMSKVTYDKILGGSLSTAHFQLQMVDQSL